MAPVPPASNAIPACCKVRLRFQKAGDLRLVSHHDLMHCFERMLRRAALPVARTRGFHPQPRMIFALSLALGIMGGNEVVELELTEDLPEADVLERLRLQAPPGLKFLSIRRIELRQSAQVRAFYRLPLCNLTAEDMPASGAMPTALCGHGDDLLQVPVPTQSGGPGTPTPGTPTPGTPAATTDLAQRCADLLAQPHCWVQRGHAGSTRGRSPGRPKRVDLRLFLSELHAQETCLEFALWVSPYGTARPEEVVHALGLAHVLEEGAVFERFDLELIDESPEGRRGIPEVSRESSHEDTSSTVEETAEGAAPDQPVAPRPTSLIGSPLSFDS